MLVYLLLHFIQNKFYFWHLQKPYVYVYVDRLIRAAILFQIFQCVNCTVWQMPFFTFKFECTIVGSDVKKHSLRDMIRIYEISFKFLRPLKLCKIHVKILEWQRKFHRSVEFQAFSSITLHLNKFFVTVFHHPSYKFHWNVFNEENKHRLAVKVTSWIQKNWFFSCRMPVPLLYSWIEKENNRHSLMEKEKYDTVMWVKLKYSDLIFHKYKHYSTSFPVSKTTSWRQ